MSLATLWSLDPGVRYLNHGSFGACPTAIQEVQTRLRAEMEREPVDFLSANLSSRLRQARAALAAFLGAEAEDLVFVPNATTGVNAVLQSLSFGPGEEILITNHTYAACRRAVEAIAERHHLRVVVVNIPFPIQSADDVIGAVLERASAQTRLALLDHVTSPTALVLPLASLVRELHGRGVDTLVDGAHAPGMVPLDLSALGAAYYTGNAHKWLCAPKGAAFLHVRRDRQARVHAPVISHGYAQGFQAEFDWTGTDDPTPWLCVPECLRYLPALVPGGWPALMQRNHELAVRARALLLARLGLPPPCPESMLGAMASIPLPEPAQGAAAKGLDAQGLHDWFRARGMEIWIHPHPRLLLRLSAQLYNDLEQFESLSERLHEALFGT
jgi:isopenicillin-N epimerase